MFNRLKLPEHDSSTEKLTTKEWLQRLAINQGWMMKSLDNHLRHHQQLTYVVLAAVLGIIGLWVFSG